MWQAGNSNDGYDAIDLEEIFFLISKKSLFNERLFVVIISFINLLTADDSLLFWNNVIFAIIRFELIANCFEGG